MIAPGVFIWTRGWDGRPPGYPFSLNNAVDALLKKEFDAHRAEGSAHPLMKKYKINAVPYPNEKLEEWRNSRTQGIKYFHQPTNLIVRGGIDDIWLNDKKELHIVDYKATSKSTEVNLDAEWQDGYKRQVEVYQWLFRTERLSRFQHRLLRLLQRRRGQRGL